jgi:hypothetical protein
MKRIVRITESDLARIVRRVIKEGDSPKQTPKECDPSTVKEIPKGKEQDYQHKTGHKAWREMVGTTKYYFCKVKSM